MACMANFFQVDQIWIERFYNFVVFHALDLRCDGPWMHVHMSNPGLDWNALPNFSKMADKMAARDCKQLSSDWWNLHYWNIIFVKSSG